MKGHVITVFIRKYAKYLEEKVSVLRLLGFQFEKQPDACKKLKLDQAFKRIPKLQSQLNALLNCKMKSHHVTQHALIVTTYVLLLKDSLILYRILNEGIVSLLDRFESMSKKSAQKTLDVYKLFIRETDALIALYDVGRHFTRSLPDIKKAKTSIVDSMQKHINKLQGGKDDGKDVEVAEDPEADELEESIEGSFEGMPAANDQKNESESDEESSSEGAPAGNGGMIDFGASLNTAPIQNPALFDPFGFDNNQTPTLASDNNAAPAVDILAPDTAQSNQIAQSYSEKASTIKDLANTLYDTGFNNFTNQFANTKLSENPFVDSTHPANSGYQGAQNPFGIGSANSIFNTSPGPAANYGGNQPAIYNTNPNQPQNNFVQTPFQQPNQFGYQQQQQPQQQNGGTNPFI
eukprot:CAMPEP_0168528116 /NCGR_PEP_ID=MMETSP0405-20121227/13057_1 /TAXON_ID=498012 /ORGANISM="Trichosphaerium sp, Strain Am-I-7 wt" /LENGTH=405 /DNA_ID=CAMNT_0008551459 /DNA_START=329 /DNA_END=1546 /DNA_ORIENTATION=+